MFIKLLIFIVLHCLVQIYGQQCLPTISGINSNVIPQFQASVVSLQQPKGPKTTEYQYSVPLKATTTSKPYEIIVAVSYIQNYFDPTALDFAAYPVPQTTSFKIVFSINVQSNWTSVHIHYIASSRQDFRVGFFIFDKSTELAATKQTKQRNVNLRYSFGDKKLDIKSQSAVVKAYISGLKYPQRFIDISIGSLSINTNSGTINVTLNIFNQKFNIQSLYIGYVVYSQINTPLIITVVNSMATFLEKSLSNQLENQFAGIISLNSKKLSTFFQRRRMLVTILQPLTAAQLIPRTQLSQFIDSFQEEGIQVQLSISNIPTIGLQIPRCLSFNECLNLGGTTANFQGRLKCIICRNNSNYDPNIVICVCDKEYYADTDNNNTCTPLFTLCQRGQTYSQGNCITPTSKILVSCANTQVINKSTRKCNCRDGFISYKKSGLQICARPCQPNFTFDLNQQKCICQPNFLDSRGNCVQCKGSISNWNPILKICQCAEGAMIFSGQCFTCSQSANYDKINKRCVCNTGFTGNGIICRRNQLGSIDNIKVVFADQTTNNRRV